MTRPGIGLQWKLTSALVLIVLVVAVTAFVMLDQIGRVSANLGANEAHKDVAAMENAEHVYRLLAETTDRLHAEYADRLARRPDLNDADPRDNLAAILAEEGARQANLTGLAVLRKDGSVVTEAKQAIPQGYREQEVTQPLATGGTLLLAFAVPDIQGDLQHPGSYQQLHDAIKAAQDREKIRSAIPTAYTDVFIIIMAVAAVVAIAVGIIMSTIVTRRIAALVTTARRVSDGRLDARVELRGRDEMAELGSAFNTMLDDLAHSRSQIEYLQRIGTWQDVARRLAHEIKNPLTPIQLAVQQTVSAYKGEDGKFKKQLDEAKEIVEEEIAGLRRLVDTFRTLGQLPKVEKAPIALGDVLEELKLDPAFAERLELVPPPQPVTVRADKLLLKRVLANLVENGIHAGAEAGAAGRVRVAWRADARGESVSITVDDQGKGVSDGDRERIFEPYVTTKSTGTGLGLAIARKIAIEHGGELSVAPDKAPTGGARFVVTLPLRGPEASLA